MTWILYGLAGFGAMVVCGAVTLAGMVFVTFLRLPAAPSHHDPLEVAIASYEARHPR